MIWKARATWIPVVTVLLGGWAGAGEAEGASPATEANALSQVESVPTPATLTLYSEAGFWGDRLRVDVSPPSDGPAVRMILYPEIQAAGLARRISSVRLRCGQRAAQIMLHTAANTQPSLASWRAYGSGFRIGCEPGRSTVVNLHDDAPRLADRVASVYFVAHAVDADIFDFSQVLVNVWAQRLREPRDGAEPLGGARLKLISPTRFSLTQYLRLDHAACGGRGASFELWVQLRPLQRDFDVVLADAYVSPGWGDLWGCQDRMLNDLQTDATAAARELEAELRPLIPARFTQGARYYYFVPNYGLDQFELVAGGRPDQEAER